MIKLVRNEEPQEGTVFVAMPFGVKALKDGTSFNFDELYEKVYRIAIADVGLEPQRADEIFSTSEGVLEAVWEGIQRSEVVLVDCTARSAAVALELGLVLALGKRLVVVAQDLQEIPVDIRGHVRPITYQTTDPFGFTTLSQKLRDELKMVRAETVTENTFVPLRNSRTEQRQGTVVLVDAERAVVETVDSGISQLWALSNTDVDYTRTIKDMRKKFRVGDRVSGAAVPDREENRRFTLLADQSNPWPNIVESFPPGKVFSARVVSVIETAGAFVSVARGVNGLIPRATLREANLAENMEVEVEIVRVDSDARHVLLQFHRVKSPGRAVGEIPQPRGEYPSVGVVTLGVVNYVKPVEGGHGGYILMRLPRFPETPQAILHIGNMSEELRSDFERGDVQRDEEFSVRILRVDASRSRIALADAPEADEVDQEEGSPVDAIPS